MLRVLIIDDSDADAKLLVRELTRAGHDVVATRVDTAAEVRTALAMSSWDLVLCDAALPSFSGLTALREVAASQPGLPLILVTGTIDEATAVEALRAGAHDLVVKSRLARLAPAVERVLREREERARTDAEVARTNDQRRRLEAIGSLAGGIAHDLNNILSVIVTYTELAVEVLPEGDAIRDDLMEVVTAAHRAADLTRQLLAFSRHQLVQPKALDLDGVVRAMEAMLRRLLRADVELVLHLGGGANVLVHPSQIEQVLMNLAINARDAMPGGGKLTIETATVELDQRYADEHPGARPGPHVLLAVRDTGCGMDEAIRARIFEPFFTTKPVGKGTGLGLPTVLGIVQQSGGSIFVDSAVGVGTTFEIYLPLAPASPPA